ncbi:dihydroorotase family protein [uncultured Cohaesibacter sp.]|uniref:dihydroorotase family protein n=1 Tax=uncultured Cohaesibacter sp. TaxID=1002546 RepID=UPI0029C9085E|nr:dihydroorotase family protein [uncultured Cohaesibacter sp.]
MAAKFDILLRNGKLVDPRNEIEARRDIAIQNGRIVAVGPTIDGSAELDFDLEGKVVMPGIIDTHVHISRWLGGREGHKMMAMAGVTTALDMAGPIEGVVELARSHGAGLSIGCINYIRPGHTVGSVNPGSDELTDLLVRSQRAGAIGLKILGGHFPLSKECSARVIRVCGEHGAYVAFHAGTLETPPPKPATMAEACELAAGHPLHMPHINTYARDAGVMGGEEVIATLAAHPNVWSESYLAPFNGTSAVCSNGVPESDATKRGVVLGGFTPNQQGMAESILAGWTHVHKIVDGTVVLATGREGYDAWMEADMQTGCSFMVNPPEPRIHLATAKKSNGTFCIDALATDGGGIPRNDIVERGLPLVRMTALSIADFVTKTSVTPAKMLGLQNKGHLAVGADADITVLDMERLVPVLAIANGHRIMENGVVFPRPSRFITTSMGKDAIEAAGMEPLLVEPGTWLPSRV